MLKLHPYVEESIHAQKTIVEIETPEQTFIVTSDGTQIHVNGFPATIENMMLMERFVYQTSAKSADGRLQRIEAGKIIRLGFTPRNLATA